MEREEIAHKKKIEKRKKKKMGFPGVSDGKEFTCNAGDLGSIPGLGRSLGGRRVWQPTPVFLPGESPWTEEPGGLQSMGSHRADTTERLNTHSTAHKIREKAEPGQEVGQFPESRTNVNFSALLSG